MVDFYLCIIFKMYTISIHSFHNQGGRKAIFILKQKKILTVIAWLWWLLNWERIKVIKTLFIKKTWMYNTRGQHNIKTHLNQSMMLCLLWWKFSLVILLNKLRGLQKKYQSMIAHEELNISSTSDVNYNIHCFHKRYSKMHGVIWFTKL